MSDHTVSRHTWRAAISGLEGSSRYVPQSLRRPEMTQPALQGRLTCLAQFAHPAAGRPVQNAAAVLVDEAPAQVDNQATKLMWPTIRL